MASQEDAPPQIRIYHKSMPSPLPSAPSFIFQLTRLKDTLLIWVGTGQPTSINGIGGTTSQAAGTQEDLAVGERKLAGEWAVAMPSRGVSLGEGGLKETDTNISCIQSLPVTGTPIFRSGASDMAVPMAQRLGMWSS